MTRKEGVPSLECQNDYLKKAASVANAKNLKIPPMVRENDVCM